MPTILDNVMAGEKLHSVKAFKAAMKQFREKLEVTHEPPFLCEKGVGLEFVDLVLDLVVVYVRLEHNARHLRISSQESEDWDAVEDLLAKLKGAAGAQCIIFQQPDLYVQLQRRLVDAGLIDVREELFEE